MSHVEQVGLECRVVGELYERYGVDEYWFVDLEGERIEVHARGDDGRYGAPVVVAGDSRLVSPTVRGLAVDVATVLPR